LKGSLQEAIDLYQAVLAHPATEHIYRQQSIRQLKEMGVEPTTIVDESILDQVVERLFSPSPA